MNARTDAFDGVSRQGPSARPTTPLRRGIAAAVLFATTWQPLLVPASHAAFSPPLINLFDTPFLVGERIPPYVMLAVTKDQQLFKKAYDDFSDIDRDGSTDTTYKHAIDYYGYFDSYKCYTYSDGSRRFEPAANTSTKYCPSGSSQWSGNFLNWATMTRMDALRKVFYGGLRSPNRSNGDGSGISDGDTASTTTLERAYLPNDAHSFTKYYDANDLNQLTPFSNASIEVAATPIGGNATQLTNSRSIDSTDKRVRIASGTGFDNGDWVQLNGPGGAYVRGKVADKANVTGGVSLRITSIKPSSIPETQAVNVYLPDGMTAANAISATGTWTLVNAQDRGITICNTTDGANSGIQEQSENNTNLPRMKVARGNYTLWNAQERWQCLWDNQSSGNDPTFSGLLAFPSAPSRSSRGLDSPGKGSVAGKGDYFVRVEACRSSLLGTERCKTYPAGNTKPIGMLQVFGETDRIRFGLMTGSYARNLSGGVLRKNVSPIDDEINSATDGTFKNIGADGVPASVAPGDPNGVLEGGSIIATLSKLKIVGYRYDDGTYFNSSVNNDNCPYQRELNTNGECKSWGNPMSEIYYESLRYFAGATSATPAFNANDKPYIVGLATAKWPTTSTSVISRKNYCAPINVLMVNGAVSTSEGDNQIPVPSFMDGSPGTPKALTNAAGALLGLSGLYYYGHADGSGSGSTGYNICSGKSLTGLGEALGICPEGPTLSGSYLMAGLAYHAHTNKVRTDITLPSSAAKLKRPALRVSTYGISIAGGIPRIPIKFEGETVPRVVIQPAYRLVQGTFGGGGALVDARVIRQVETPDRAYGQIMVSWEDSEAGGDYDMDVWGIINYEMSLATGTIAVTTDTIGAATANPQGFGYVISGTLQDGLHYHSGIIGFDYNDPTPPLSVVSTTAGRVNASGGCNNCEVGDGPTTATYTLSTTPPAKTLQDPLYYASLLGGFEDANGDGVPDASAPVAGVFQPSEFDKRNNFTGTDQPDGVPDNFFKVDNPLGLELGLERTFQLISEQSSLATLQSSSTRIVAGSAVYQAKFNSGDWSGSLEALPISSDGTIGNPTWNAATANLTAGLVDHDNRRILTMNSATRSPVAFRYSNLSTTQKADLDTVDAAAPDGRGADRLAYLRGDPSLEGDGLMQFRRRSATVLGDIVDSSPVHVGKPSAGIGSASYLSFIAAQSSRTPMLYVGANDGMLHGFDATNGHEVFAYVPTKAFKNLAALTAQDYIHRNLVNGQLATQDVQVGGTWRTYLVGGLGSGGQGVFGLDVTNPAGASEANPGAIVKWEFTDADDDRLGYVFGHPLLRQLEGGEWVAIFGSGYNATHPDDAYNTSGKASIFVLKLSGPTGSGGQWTRNSDYWRIDITGSDTGTSTGPNGLGGIASYDLDGDGRTDYLYAGDLLGNLWRVDVRTLTSTATGALQRVFVATDGSGARQPITAAPALAVGPNFEGVFVVLGTGKMLETSDLGGTGTVYQQQTLYGIWDKDPSVFGGLATVTKASLMPQREIIREGNGAYANGSVDNGQIDFSLTSAYVPNYTDTARTNLVYGNTNPLSTGPTSTTAPNQRGWYFDVPGGTASGERAIYRPELVGPFAIFVNAIPSALACEGGGAEAQYALEALTGGRSAFGGFDRDANGKIQGRNGSMMGDQSSFGLPPTTAGGSPQQFFASRRETTGGFGQMTIMKSAGSNSLGGGTSAGTAVDACAGGGLAPIGAQSSTTGLILTQRLPGGCIGRVQWREVIRH
ncbi:MAG: pilus assembly protein [Lautropia sp.]